MTDVLDTEGSLTFWHPVDDGPPADSYLLEGMIAAGSSGDVRLRVHNDSDLYAAAAVVVAVGAPADTDLADASGEYLLSGDGATFTATITLPDLPPQAVSEPFTLRRVTPPDTPVGVYGYQLFATATTWRPAAAGGAGGGDAYDPQAVDAPLDGWPVTA